MRVSSLRTRSHVTEIFLVVCFIFSGLGMVLVLMEPELMSSEIMALENFRIRSALCLHRTSQKMRSAMDCRLICQRQKGMQSGKNLSLSSNVLEFLLLGGRQPCQIRNSAQLLSGFEARKAQRKHSLN